MIAIYFLLLLQSTMEGLYIGLGWWLLELVTWFGLFAVQDGKHLCIATAVGVAVDLYVCYSDEDCWRSM